MFVLAAASFSLFSCLFFVYPWENKNRKRKQKTRKRAKKICIPCFLNGDKCIVFFFHLDDWLLMRSCKVEGLILELSGYDQGKED